MSICEGRGVECWWGKVMLVFNHGSVCHCVGFLITFKQINVFGTRLTMQFFLFLVMTAQNTPSSEPTWTFFSAISLCMPHVSNHETRDSCNKTPSFEMPSSITRRHPMSYCFFWCLCMILRHHVTKWLLTLISLHNHKFLQPTGNTIWMKGWNYIKWFKQQQKSRSMIWPATFIDLSRCFIKRKLSSGFMMSVNF